MKTPAETTLKIITDIIAKAKPGYIQHIFFELKDHEKMFQRIRDNIRETSLGLQDEQDRTKALCEQYGYDYRLEVVSRRIK